MKTERYTGYIGGKHISLRRVKNESKIPFIVAIGLLLLFIPIVKGWGF